MSPRCWREPGLVDCVGSKTTAGTSTCGRPMIAAELSRTASLKSAEMPIRTIKLTNRLSREERLKIYFIQFKSRLKKRNVERQQGLRRPLDPNRLP
jgi:hypothetical protein